MSNHNRIMLLEPNRYRALLLQRMLEQYNSSAIVARFSDPDQALAELGRNGYIAVVVNIDSTLPVWPDFFQSVVQESPGIHLVALTSDRSSAAKFGNLYGISQCHLVHVDEAAEMLASLSDLSGSSPEDSDWQPVESRSTRPPAMIVAGQ